MLSPADHPGLVILVAMVAAILAVMVLVRVHWLFSTGLTFWLLVMALSISAYALATGLFPGEIASAVADVSIVITGCAAYAASRWLRRTFEVGGKGGS